MVASTHFLLAIQITAEPIRMSKVLKHSCPSLSAHPFRLIFDAFSYGLSEDADRIANER